MGDLEELGDCSRTLTSHVGYSAACLVCLLEPIYSLQHTQVRGEGRMLELGNGEANGKGYLTQDMLLGKYFLVSHDPGSFGVTLTTLAFYVSLQICVL